MLVQFVPDQNAIGFPVLGTRGFDDFRRKLRARRGFCPPHSLQIVANKLFVKRRLRTARAVMSGGPEAGGIGREGFVDPDQFPVEQAKFKFRVGENDAARFGIGNRAAIDFETDGADSLGKFLADERCSVVERDVFVMAGGRFCCGRKDGFRQAVGFGQAAREWNAADFSSNTIVFPT